MDTRLRLCYKIEVWYVKYIPFVISFFLIIYHTLRFFFPIDLFWLQYFCMPSMLTSFHMINTRKAFGLCKVHKCCVLYVIFNMFILIAEHYWVLPYANTAWYLFILAISIIVFIFGTYFYKLEHEKLNCKSLEETCC